MVASGAAPSAPKGDEKVKGECPPRCGRREGPLPCVLAELASVDERVRRRTLLDVHGPRRIRPSPARFGIRVRCNTRFPGWQIRA